MMLQNETFFWFSSIKIRESEYIKTIWSDLDTRKKIIDQWKFSDIVEKEVQCS